MRRTVDIDYAVTLGTGFLIATEKYYAYKRSGIKLTLEKRSLKGVHSDRNRGEIAKSGHFNGLKFSRSRKSESPLFLEVFTPHRTVRAVVLPNHEYSYVSTARHSITIFCH